MHGPSFVVYTHTNLLTTLYKCIYIHTYTYKYICRHVYTCTCIICVLFGLNSCPTQTRTSVPTHHPPPPYIQPYANAYTYIYTHIYTHTCIIYVLYTHYPTYNPIQMHIHTYMHTYIYTHASYMYYSDRIVIAHLRRSSTGPPLCAAHIRGGEAKGARVASRTCVRHPRHVPFYCIYL